MSFSVSLSSLTGFREQSRLEKLLQPGARIRARVTAALGDGRIRLAFGGQSLLLRPEKPLAEGTLLELRVHATPKGPVLEIVTDASPSERIASPSQPAPSFSSQSTGSFGRMLQLLAFLGQRSGSVTSGGERMSFLLPRIPMNADPLEIRNLLRDLVRLLFHDPVPSQGLRSGTVVREMPFFFSLETLAEKEGGVEGRQLVEEFRESLAKNLVEQNRIYIPLPLGLDSLFLLGRFYMDLGDGGRGETGSRILRAGLSLDLESLGRIRADALLLGKDLQLGFGAEAQDILALFENGMPDLMQRLQSLGFHVLPVRYHVLDERGKEEEEESRAQGGCGIIV
ncbi:flagellar hook-length control protein FliK [Desulfobotulus sp. H1]|uniref:Flagellar hook-length control protein FliK n=1 Tax=Desulfobotulus pelophilus TaxID=2823377 RepID=A0ABT3N4I7_9BACT|nr:flagellar hook-length control protein FliK [Desulfobotulus pelophilus]